MQPIVVYTTFPNLQAAEAICGQLLQEKCIACANLGAPMVSLYSWQGELNREMEIPALLKTDKSHENALYQKLKDRHPYDAPCIMTLAVDNIEVDYLSWMQQTLIR